MRNDAMHEAEAEATLTEEEYSRYRVHLARICNDDYYELRKGEHFSADPISAKAHQRARAFLRVKQKTKTK